MRKLLILITLMIASFAIALPARAQQGDTAPTDSDSSPTVIVAPELFRQAGEAAQAGNYQRALLDYSLFILFNPTDSQGYYARALTYQLVEKPDASLDDLEQAIAFAPAIPEYTARVYLNRASLLLDQNEIDAALDDLDTSLGLAPDQPDTLLTRASVYAFQERYEDALEDYNRVIALVPEDTRAYSQRGVLNMRLGNLDAALTDLSRAIDINPENGDTYINRALVYNLQDDFDNALTDLDSALDLNPQNVGLYVFRGAVNTRANHPVDAATDYLQWMDTTNIRQITPTEDTPLNQPFVIDMGQGWVYNFMFEAEEGQVLNVIANRLDNAEADPLLVLVNEERAALVADDDSGGDMNAAIYNYVIPEDGEYTVILGHALGGASGQVGVLVGLDQ